MLTGKNLILATRKFANEQPGISWFHTIFTFLILCASLAGTLPFLPMPFRCIFSVFSGLVVVRMFVIYHDYLHGAILHRSTVAKLLFRLFGLYVLAPETIWKRTHDHHHKHNSKYFKHAVGSYPVVSLSKFRSFTSKEKFSYLFVRHPLTILFGYIFTFLYGMCIDPLIHGFRKHFDSFAALVLHVTIMCLVTSFFGWKTLLLFSIVPHFISGALGAFLFYVQHNFPGVYYAGDDEWTYEGSALESSSFLSLGPFMNWVTGNIGYHHIHHLNARIPFYRLPEVMKSIRELQAPKTIKMSVADVLHCFRLKVWDVEKKEMVSLPVVVKAELKKNKKSALLRRAL